MSRSVIGILLLIFVLYLALMTPFIQTRLVKYFTGILEERTGTTITIGRVEFRPIESLILEDVFVKDCRNDTLLFCERLHLRVDSVSFVKRHFTITEAVFERATFNLWIERGKEGEESLTNVEQLIHSLSPSTASTSSSSSGWNVHLRRMALEDCQFRYIEQDYEPVDYGINWTDVDCRKLNLTISDIDFSNERYKVNVSGLSFKEKSGFEVLNMEADVVVSSDHLLVTNTLIQTARSEAHLDTLEYEWVPNQDYWRNFTTKMQQRYVFSSSRVNFDDLAYFNGRLLGMHNTISGGGVVFNTVSRLQGRDLEVHLGDSSVMYGSFTSEGLPRFFDADFNLDITSSRVSPTELEAIYMPWLDDRYLEIPEMLHKYEVFNVEGNFRGKIEDFLVQAKSTTPGLEGDVLLTLVMDSTGGYRYRGEVGLNHVKYGFLTGQSMIGDGSLYGAFEGISEDTLSSFTLSSRVGYLDVFDTRVHNIKLTLGTWNDHLYLLLSVKNDSLQANFMLNYQMGDTLSLADAQGYVKVRQWDSWGPKIFGDKESFELAFSGKLKQSGTSSWLELFVPKLKYENTRGAFALDSLTFENTFLDEYSYSHLESGLVDATLEGFFRSLEMKDLVNSLVVSYFPAYKYAVNESLPVGTSLQLDMRLKDVNPLLRVVYPELKVSPGAMLTCDYNYADRHVKLFLQADSASYGDFNVYRSRVNLEGNGVKMNGVCTADKLTYMDLGQLYNVRNVMNVSTNNVSNKLSWCNWEQESYSGCLSADLRLLKYRERYLTQVLIEPSVFVMADSIWNVGRSMILKEGDDIFVNNFEISRGNQRFGLKGRVSNNSRDLLSVVFDNFNLAEFNKILFDNKMKLFGQVNGQVDISDFYKNCIVNANVDVDHWGVNQDTLGLLNVRSSWDANTNALQVDVSNKMKDRTPVWLFGYYKPTTDSVNLQLNLAGIEVNYLTTYFPDVLKNGSGTISGEFRMTGTSKNSTIDGFLAADSVALTLAGLNTAFAFHDRLLVKNSQVLLNDFKIRDAKGRFSECSGYYDLSRSLYDVNVKFNNFMVLNTVQEQSESFYGQLFISGQTRVNNLSGHPALSINLKPEAHSVLYVPLTSTLNEEDGNFLHFIGKRQDTGRRPTPEVKASLVAGLDLNANIEMNDNLEVQIIFDPTIGDILKTVGSGNIQVSLGKNDKLNLFGEYKIEKGDYLFTLSNLVNKKFVLNPGGGIKWNGSPYDATIDVSAVYNLKTSLNDLLTGTSLTMDKNTKVPVECVLKLEESLMNPNVQFGINFPSLDMQMRSLMQSLFSSQDEVNKQMFSLLILNKFYTPDYVDKDPTLEERNAGYQMGVTTASELLSNQLSRWLSQISNNFDIGFSYRPGDQVTTNEFELALSTQILNNRVTISANGNMMEKAKTNSNTAITGDFDVDVKINRQGTLKLKAYSHTDEKITYNATETVQGVGISYQEAFDTFRELVRKYLAIFGRKKQTVPPAQVVDAK